MRSISTIGWTEASISRLKKSFTELKHSGMTRNFLQFFFLPQTVIFVFGEVTTEKDGHVMLRSGLKGDAD